MSSLSFRLQQTSHSFHHSLLISFDGNSKHNFHYIFNIVSIILPADVKTPSPEKHKRDEGKLRASDVTRFLLSLSRAILNIFDTFSY